MIPLKSLLKEGTQVKIPIKYGRTSDTIMFTHMVGRDGNVIFIAGSGAELDKLQDIMSEPTYPAYGVNQSILEFLEKKLKVPFRMVPDYPGAGFAFKVDLDGLLKKL